MKAIPKDTHRMAWLDGRAESRRIDVEQVTLVRVAHYVPITFAGSVMTLCS